MSIVRSRASSSPLITFKQPTNTPRPASSSAKAGTTPPFLSHNFESVIRENSLSLSPSLHGRANFILFKKYLMIRALFQFAIFHRSSARKDFATAFRKK